jgi:hypothetical protein
VISFHGVVGVLLQDVPAARNQVIEHARVDRCPVGGDLRRRWSAGQRPGEERRAGAPSRRSDSRTSMTWPY